MAELNTPIVVVAYNRPKSLLRLLNSLAGANYPNKNIDLIISIDKSDDNQNVLAIAKNFKWEFGNKIVNYQETNLGLKAHILKCGDFSNTYGAVIVLEDDLFVSSNFYNYTVAALQFSRDKGYIGGISLYNHQLNVHTRDNFIALEDGFDNWYFQFASSWGQAWSKDQWKGFRKWLRTNPDINNNQKTPLNVRSWSDKSWLKLYITYLIEKDRYFLYPKISLTSNFSDAGTHITKNSTIYQVPLYFGTKTNFNFSNIKNSHAVYNAFYENIRIYDKIGFTSKSCSIDLYGYRPHDGQQYMLTSKILNFKILQSYGRSLKPLDANIFCDIIGNDFFLYDTSVKARNNYNFNSQRNLYYNIKQIDYKDALITALKMTLAKRHGLYRKLKNWMPCY